MKFGPITRITSVIRTEHLFSKYFAHQSGASVDQFGEQAGPVASAEVCIRMLPSASRTSSEPQEPVVAQVAVGCTDCAPATNASKNKEVTIVGRWKANLKSALFS
jgi:hypothetical protein